MTDTVLKAVDRDARTVTLDLPEGMFDLYFGADDGAPED